MLGASQRWDMDYGSQKCRRLINGPRAVDCMTATAIPGRSVVDSLQLTFSYPFVRVLLEQGRHVSVALGGQVAQELAVRSGHGVPSR